MEKQVLRLSTCSNICVGSKIRVLDYIVQKPETPKTSNEQKPGKSKPTIKAFLTKYPVVEYFDDHGLVNLTEEKANGTEQSKTTTALESAMQNKHKRNALTLQSKINRSHTHDEPYTHPLLAIIGMACEGNANSDTSDSVEIRCGALEVGRFFPK